MQTPDLTNHSSVSAVIEVNVKALPPKYLSTAKGITLIEILIAMVVVGFGVFGIAKLQISGLRNTKQAYYMTEALMATQGMAERMRINLVAARQGAYHDFLNAATTGKQCTDGGCNSQKPSQLTLQDQQALRNALFQLGYQNYGQNNNPNGQIRCSNLTPGSTEYAKGSYCDITTWWPDIHRPGKALYIDKSCGRDDKKLPEGTSAAACVSMRVMLTQ